MKKEDLVKKIISNTLIKKYDINEVIEPKGYVEEEICNNISNKEYMDVFFKEFNVKDGEKTLRL